MLKLKLQYFGHLMQLTDSLEKTLMLGKIEGRRRRGQQMSGWHHWLNRHGVAWTLGVGDGQGGWCTAIHGFTKSWTWLNNWTELNWFLCIDHWRRLSYLSLLSFGTLHSNQYIFPFLLCLSLLFYSQLFVRPPQTTTLPFCISFAWGWSWFLPPVLCHEPPSIVHQALYQIKFLKSISHFHGIIIRDLI